MKHSRKKLPPLGEGWGGAFGWLDGLSAGLGRGFRLALLPYLHKKNFASVPSFLAAVEAKP